MTPDQHTPDLDSVEDRLRDALRQRADATPIGVRERRQTVRRPRRRPSRTRLSVVVLAGVAAAVAGFVVVRDPGDDQRVSTGPAAETAPSDMPPRLVVDLPGASVARVAETTIAPIAHPGNTYLQAYRVPGQVTPVLFVRVVPPPPSTPSAPSDIRFGFSFGETSPGSERVTVNGRPAYLNRYGGRITSLGIPDQGGGGLSLTPHGLEADEVLAAAEALTPRPDGAVGVDAVRPLPRGLTLVAEGGGPQPSGVFVEALITLAGGARAQLNVEPSNAAHFEDRVQDRLASARSVEAVSVLDRPGYLVVYDAPGNDSTMLWQPAEGWRAELRAPVDAAGMRAIAAAVRLLDEADWRAVVPRPVPPEDQPGEARRLQADIPLPPGVTWDGLPVGRLEPERYLFNTAVVRHALCAWSREHERARAEGDGDAAARAIQAIAGAPEWTSVKELATAGGYPNMAETVASLGETSRDPAGLRKRFGC